MKQESGFYCSHLFKSQEDAIRQEICQSLGFFYQKPITSPQNEREVCLSLQNFARYMNYAQLENFLLNYLKKDQKLPEGKSFIRPVMGRPDASPTYVLAEPSNYNSGHIFLDGRYGFLWCLRSPGEKLPLVMAATSFSPANSIATYTPELFYPGESPIIIQLQSLHDYSNRNYERSQLAKDALRSFRWEHALIGLNVLWARGVNLNQIHILPGSRNRYITHKREETMKLRYDVSAERCGFRLNVNGLWTLPLETLRKSS